jgi:hypothetical protein
MGQSTTNIPDKDIGEFHQSSGDSGTVHDFAGKDEKRHGHEGEHIQPAEELERGHREHGHIVRHHVHTYETGDTNGEPDWYTQQKKCRKDYDY